MAKKKTARSVNSIRNAIRKALRDAGVYSKLFDMAIEDLATVTHLKEKIFLDATEYEFPDDLNNGNEGSMLVERSREGEFRYKNNPSYHLYLDFVRESQKILEALGMTIKTSEGVEDDKFSDLAEVIKNAVNGERGTNKAKK